MDSAANDALLQYDIDGVTSTDYQQSGYSNCSYRVDTADGAYLFREFLSHSRAAVEQEFILLGALKLHGCPTAHPIRSRAGEALTTRDGRLFALFPFLPGAEPAQTAATAQAIGRAAGHLSLLRPPPGFDAELNGSWSRALAFCKSTVSHTLPEKHRRFLEAEGNRFAQELPNDLPFGVIHADLFPDNVLFLNNELIAVLDFEEACVDTLLLDIGVAIQGFCFPDGTLDQVLMGALLAGYEKHRPLEAAEQEHLDDYIRYGLFGILFWHLSHRPSPPNPRQSARIDELMLRYTTL